MSDDDVLLDEEISLDWKPPTNGRRFFMGVMTFLVFTALGLFVGYHVFGFGDYFEEYYAVKGGCEYVCGSYGSGLSEFGVKVYKQQHVLFGDGGPGGVVLPHEAYVCLCGDGVTRYFQGVDAPLVLGGGGE